MDIAAENERTISREHVTLEPVAVRKFLICNNSSKNPVFISLDKLLPNSSQVVDAHSFTIQISDVLVRVHWQDSGL